MRMILISALFLFSASPVFAAGPMITAPDRHEPVVGNVINFSVNAQSEGTSMERCEFFKNGKYQGAMVLTNSVGTFSFIHKFDKVGTFEVQVKCKDGKGAVGASQKTKIVVRPKPDRIAPEVGEVTPRLTRANTETVFRAPVKDAKINSCSFAVEGEEGPLLTKEMKYEKGFATVRHTFEESGAYTVSVTCLDAMLNKTQTLSRVGVIPKLFAVKVGDVIKMWCTAGSDPTDNCSAVYYLGRDARLHYFPSEPVFRSWYADFSGVRVASPEIVQSMMVGDPVSVRPGSRMVKFVGDPRVYAVFEENSLRHIPSEQMASELGGTNWSRWVIELAAESVSEYKIKEPLQKGSDWNAREIRNRVKDLSKYFGS